MSDNRPAYDVDGDGKLSEQDLAIALKRQDIELRNDKAETQRRMARAAMAGIIILLILVLSPIIDTARLEAVKEIIISGIYGFVGIVGFFMGASTWMHKDG